MRSFASAVLTAILLAVLAPTLAAQSSQSQTLYADAMEHEAALRKDMDAHRADAPTGSLLRRVRTLVGAYDDMARLFATSGYSDNSLWQGASLSADAFWQFGEAEDAATALRLFGELTTRFSTSALARQVPAQVKRLKEATTGKPSRTAAAQPLTQPPASRPAPRSEPPTTRAAPAASPAVAPSPARTAATPAQPVVSPPAAPATQAAVPPPAPAAIQPAAPPPVRTAPAPVRTAPAPPPAPASSGPSFLTAIRREVLPDALRVTLEFDREVAFRDERLDAPSRVFIDLQNTRAVAALRDAVLPFTDDLVAQIRVGRQLNTRTRVVLDLKGTGRYSVYALYNPYRVVIDFERPGDRRSKETKPTIVASGPSVAATPIPAGAPGASWTSAPAVPAPVATAAATTAAAALPVAGTNGAATPASEAAPAPPSVNAGGGFSLSRQLGLGVTRIVIDAGHGGRDPGAKAKGLNEADLVLDIALRLEKLLLKERGVEVLLTRREDDYIALEERTAIANRGGADLFLSIHANASPDSNARGIETYFLNFAPDPQAEAIAARENAGSAKSMRHLPDIVKAIALNNKIDESRDFARFVQTSLYAQLRKANSTLKNLGVKQAPFMVLIGATMPSVLAEISFMTNSQEAALLKTGKYRQQIAESLLDGVMRYQQSLKKASEVASQ